MRLLSPTRDFYTSLAKSGPFNAAIEKRVLIDPIVEFVCSRPQPMMFSRVSEISKNPQ